MVVYNVHNEVVTRQFRAHICSFATIFSICVIGITYLSPLFLAYNSLGFWLKESTYREQPEVNYKHHLILLVQGSDPGSLIGYSTYPNFNLLLGDKIRIPTIRSFELDEDYDGRKDYLQFNIDVPLLNHEKIQSVQLLFFFDYKLHKFASLQMESLAYIYYTSPSPGKDFYTQGELRFQQKAPLPHKGSFTQFNASIIDPKASTVNELRLQTIFEKYQGRKVRTDYIGRCPVWKSGLGSPFTIKGKIEYPDETIIYRPGFWQLIKFAWIQYLAILLIFLYIFGHVKKFVYENHLVNTIPRKSHVD